MPQSSEVVQSAPIAEPARKPDALTSSPPLGGASARRAANAVSSVAWIPQGDLGEDEWLATGRRLGAICRGSQWWLADWLRHGAGRWGDRYSEAARITGFDRGTLRSLVWIAERVNASVRNEKLTWDHHVAVASLSEEEQREWLERAESEGLSAAELKLALDNRRQAGTDGTGEASP